MFILATKVPKRAHTKRETIQLVSEEEIAELDPAERARSKDAQQAADEPSTRLAREEWERVEQHYEDDDEPDLCRKRN